MQVAYITHSGSDLTVVNAARVSFDKESKELDSSDIKLLKYLATHDHWTPFAHPQITLRVKAPIFVRTQCFKHKVGFVENEISRRYVDSAPDFFTPKVWRERDTNKKQGSKDTGILEQDLVRYNYTEFTKKALALYNDMLKLNVAPEQARMVLPQSMFTEWYWTGSLAAYARFCRLRREGTAQKEVQELAGMVAGVVGPLYPECFSVLLK